MSFLAGEGSYYLIDVAPIQDPDAVGMGSEVGGRLWARRG